MNASLHCVFLLACVVTCFCSPAIKRCQCVSTIPSINPRLISGVKVYVSRPYCKNMEVIVRLNDSSSTCLDTKTQFTKDLLKAVEMKKAAQAAQQKQQQTQTQ